MKGLKNVVYMSVALGMIVYAVPRIDMSGTATLQTVFSIVWIAFSLMIVAAHLHELLGVDEEKRKELDKIKRMKRWQMEQLVKGKRKVLQVRR